MKSTSEAEINPSRSHIWAEVIYMPLKYQKLQMVPQV